MNIADYKSEVNLYMIKNNNLYNLWSLGKMAS